MERASNRRFPYHIGWVSADRRGLLMGPGEAFNSNRCFIVCSNVAGSPYGTISPVSINPDTGGPYCPSFPPAFIRDDMLYVSSHSLIHVGGSGLTITPTRYRLKFPQTCTGPSRRRIRRGRDRRFNGRDDRLPMASLHISWFRSPYHPTRCDLRASLGMVYLVGRDPETVHIQRPGVRGWVLQSPAGVWCSSWNACAGGYPVQPLTIQRRTRTFFFLHRQVGIYCF